MVMYSLTGIQAQTKPTLESVQDIIPVYDFGNSGSNINARKSARVGSAGARVGVANFQCTGLANLDFSASRRTRLSGSDLQVGAVYRYANVLTVGSLVIDAIVTIESIQNGRILELDLESQGYPTALQPRFGTVNSRQANALGSAVLDIRFVESGTLTSYMLPAFNSYLVDIDGETDFNEFQAISNASNIDFGSGAQNNIDVLSDVAPFNNRYQDKTQSSADGIPLDIFNRMVRAEFVNTQSFKWKFGVRYRDSSGGSSERLFSFFVLCIPEFETEEQDFGDAPAPYPTLNANNGASHVATSTTATPRFGAVVDREANGLPSANADGDDTDSADPMSSADDEDGVTITGSFTANVTKQITINTRGSGRVSGWIDWNKDGDWNDEGEKVIDDVAVTTSTSNTNFANFNIQVPCDAVSGDTYARFRISSNEGLQPTGPATNGEVEDYKVTVIGAAGMVPVTFSDQPDPSTYCQNEVASALSVTAAGSGTLTYQWFSNTENNTTSGTAIDGATARTYTPSTAQVGELYLSLIHISEPTRPY